MSGTTLRITGPEERVWAWSELMDLRVEHVPVRSVLVRWATRGALFAAAALDAWLPGSPAEMTVVISTGNDQIETGVLSAAATAYTQREVDLSHALLSHFVRGTASPTILTDWWNKTQPAQILRSRQREALLEDWTAPLLA
ncbi:hypothetical protein N4G70_35395 [Streptomyces sp. ASQP_92]|uniref:hypothetical protein n=1 Tax=Streptomyces sp. ASQP_92 TaxID=2979116 RepID=UPI0021BE4343|nr:hypothetical protein [Streptomyces sp. ASQP_92]MCT9094095.1 hypothetical protein [Streptomyces sp. ASQP_92]